MSMQKPDKRTLLIRLGGLVIAGLTVWADQATKAAILRMTIDHPVHYSEIFNLVLVWNRGVSFGMFNNNLPPSPLIFIAVSGVIGAGFAIWLLRTQRSLISIAAGLVIGGAVGNIIDRWRIGAVIDFLDLHIGTWHWPAFNIADSAIVTGIALILLDGLWSSIQKRKNNS